MSKTVPKWAQELANSFA